MPVAPGTRLGGYVILGDLGSGGMGEVYRARDTVLHREVALKLVRPDLCHQPDSMLRIKREAIALAALNHPNVATLHELAEFGDGCGLVMELVSGETLAEAVRRRRRLPIAEAIAIAAQVAAGLEAAHEHGIVHRDLKPANIKITPEGTAKVLDFGLAKTDADSPEAGMVSTLASSAGAIIGTAPYMSPEQARGAPVDRRTDLWAFGCVLYEMLTGRLAFDGGSRSDIIVAILEKEPDWSALPPETPRAVERILRRCLQKEVRRRYRDAGDARLELEDALADSGSVIAAPAAPLPPARRSWLGVAALIGSGAALGGLLAAAWPGTGAQPVSNQVRFAISVPDDERLAATALGGLAISPSAQHVVYVAVRGNTTQLVVRSLDSATSTPLQGTFGAVSPFFSPDSEWIAFFADAKLKKIPVRGGPPVTICDAADGLGGSWSPNGTIVFASATGSPLQRVPAEGGAPSRATDLDVSRGEFSHRWPEFLPDGETVLFTVGTVGEWDEAEIVAERLDSGSRTVVLKGGTNPRFLAGGHLAYAHDNAIWMVGFDPGRLSVTGTPVRAIEGVTASVDGAAQFSVSQNGASVYVPSSPDGARRLVVVDGDDVTPLAAPLHRYVTPRVSPDGRRVLLGVADGSEHVWSYDLGAGTLTQLTFEAANRAPIWSPGARRVTFASNRNGPLNLFDAPAAADGPAERLTTSDSLQLPGDWSPDGQLLALMEQSPATGRDIWLQRRAGERTVFANGAADEGAPRFSPDGRWIAYVSNESGQAEILVKPASGAGPGRRISAAGGSEPVWRRDGAMLFYRAEGGLLGVPMANGAPQSSAARVVFTGAAETGSFDAAGYDTLPGNRLLIVTSAAPVSAPSELRVILNWSSLTSSP